MRCPDNCGATGCIYCDEALQPDFTGAQIVMYDDDRMLLGDVTATITTPSGIQFLRVQHFNGEPWPLSPRVAAVVILHRDYDPLNPTEH
jgi:hypothetical protein